MDTSLRSRRSQAPERKAQRQGTKLSKGGPTTRNARNKSKSRVDDKIKKRMSMRYADISSPTELVPDMPGLDQSLMSRGRPGRDNEEVASDRIGLGNARPDDIELLEKEDFDPDAYLKIKLANSTEAELKSLQSSLRDAKDSTLSDLQRNVFKNYAEFVLISKEISTLENEMLELKESLSEYKSMPTLLHVPDPSSTSSSTLSSYRRSSVADLRIMYFNQMQTLHTQIEGSAKFVPTTPGRHVVGEVEGVLALNAATYKPTGKVRFVILDDAVLIAKRRRRTAGTDNARSGSISEGKLVAERSWSLNEMLVLDTKDSPSMTNVFKIRHGKETHVYRTETAADKKTLLQQLRSVAEELSAKKRKEREGEHERRKSLWQGGEGLLSPDRVPPMPDWLDFAARSPAQSPGRSPDTNARQKAERDAQWISEWADTLTVAIALKEWEKATKLVEDGRVKMATTPALGIKLSVLSAELTSALLAALTLPSNRKSTVVSLISLLVRLNAGSAARSTFLGMRSQVIRNHMRKIRFEGHIGAYVGDLAVIYFTGIKHTADWFLASFKENEVASAFIDWAKTEVANYAEMFRRQVYSADADPKIVEEAKSITYSQSKKLLEDFGLDFRFLLDDLLLEKPKEKMKAAVPFSYQERTVPAPPAVKLQPPPLTTNLAKRSSPSSSKPNTGTSTPTSNPSFSAFPPTSATSLYTGVSAASPNPAQSAGIRSRTPTSAASALPTPDIVLSPAADYGDYARSPVPGSPLRSATGSTFRDRPPRTPRIGNPAPPPRSSNRPGSISHRPPPVAVPQREGMI
ncbi:nuclear mRNA splicing protein [Mycena floridula]|nr:nuclear mRNA splicing protein [Mycena floridula]